ncbi:hypothetical protein [Micromonospora orduensis]|uniref:hypothetical protein n=1 Tax=Micromonospora orduensis TaxID=1420891 RepID=UPI0033E4632A
MSPRIADLGDVLAHTFATPAPTTPQPTPANLFPHPLPTGPRVVEKACGCGVLDGEDCDCAEFTAQARAVNRRPIFFDFRKPEAA